MKRPEALVSKVEEIGPKGGEHNDDSSEASIESPAYSDCSALGNRLESDEDQHNSGISTNEVFQQNEREMSSMPSNSSNIIRASKFPVNLFGAEQNIQSTSQQNENETVAEPDAKKRRIDSLRIDHQWLNSCEESIGKKLADAMQEMKECKEKSWKYISQLKTSLKNTNEKLRLLENTHKQEKADLEVKMSGLINENRKLRECAKTCQSCGNIVDSVSFCNRDCYENNIKLVDLLLR